MRCEAPSAKRGHLRAHASSRYRLELNFQLVGHFTADFQGHCINVVQCRLITLIADRAGLRVDGP
jgi:hypothetical protein